MKEPTFEERMKGFDAVTDRILRVSDDIEKYSCNWCYKGQGFSDADLLAVFSATSMLRDAFYKLREVRCRLYKQNDPGHPASRSRFDDAPTHIREAFQEFLEGDEDTVDVDGEQRGLPWFVERLTDCTDILPAGHCSDLDLPQGSSYGDAVKHLAKEAGK